VTKDGVTVAEEIEFRDKIENQGAQLVKEVASKTSDDAGDGTTTATVLAEAIFKSGLRHLTSGCDANAMVRGIRKAVENVTASINNMSQSVADNIEAVATISANNDTEIGKIMATAFSKVGKDGVITVEEGKSLDTFVDVVEGMQFDRGFLSPNFVTDVDNMTTVLEKPLVLIYEDKFDSAKQIVPLLEKVMESKRSLLIIAEDITGEALSTLVINKLRGVLQVAAVKAPGYGDRRKAMLEDIAVLTGGEAIMKDLGIDIEKISLSQLGQAKKIEITNKETTLTEGAGTSEAIQQRIGQIRAEIEKSTSDYDSEKLQERLAKLAGGIAQINVGAASEVELKERKARVEDALHATRAAIEEGIVPGGGVSFIRSIDALLKAKSSVRGDEKIGFDVVRDALTLPLQTIADNAGAKGSVVVAKVSEMLGSNGFNALTLEYCDLLKDGVITPAKVDRCALQNAASVACLMLSTDCIITAVPSDEDDHAAAGGMGGMDPMGGMGGMGGMPGMGF
jgi:chaperonin GroEL